MKIINLTGNDIRIINHEGEDILIERSNMQAKVYVTREEVGRFNDIPIVKSVKSKPVGIPDPEEGTYYVVSKMVAEKLKEIGRYTDILIPDEIIRGRKGEIIGCKSLTFS